MILFKNRNSQVVYTRITNVSTGAGVLVADPETNIIAYISKDSGTLTAATNTVTKVLDTSDGDNVSTRYYGLYRVTLTATETNCDSGVIVFMDANNTWPNSIAETVYFQTSEFTPQVGIASGTYNYNTSGYVYSVQAPGTIVGAINSNTVDTNVTLQQLYKLLLSFMSGKVIINHNNPSTGKATLKYHDQSNSLLLTIEVDEDDGARDAKGTFAPS